MYPDPLFTIQGVAKCTCVIVLTVYGLNITTNVEWYSAPIFNSPYEKVDFPL